MAVLSVEWDPEHFQKIMGRGGVISSRRKPEHNETPQPDKPTQEELDKQPKKED